MLTPDRRSLSPNYDLIGVRGGIAKLTTPALILDLPAFRANTRQMVKQCTDAGIQLRPHGKTHKCSRIALEQLANGARGICAATAREGIVFANAGIRGILVTAPVAQLRHMQALAELTQNGADIAVVIDHPNGVAAWQSVLGNTGRPVQALVDIDLGMQRTGATSIEMIIEIARAINVCPALRYVGVQAYSGRVQHINDYAERRKAYWGQLDKLEGAISALSSKALAPEIISGGGTGTFGIDVERGIYTESQAGSFAFMDVEYNEVEFFKSDQNPYLTALYLRTSVVSANLRQHVTLNAGFKAFATDGPLPLLYGGAFVGCEYELYGDEYGRLLLKDGRNPPPVGTYVDLITPHCDPTVNLHDYFHVVEGDTIVDVWDIDARGVL
jgi:3-hydroxy-D-aspartate aldolase